MASITDNYPVGDIDVVTAIGAHNLAREYALLINKGELTQELIDILFVRNYL